MQLPLIKTVDTQNIKVTTQIIEDATFLTVKYTDNEVDIERSVSTKSSNLSELQSEERRLIEEVIVVAKELLNAERGGAVYTELATNWLPRLSKAVDDALKEQLPQDQFTNAVNAQIQAITSSIGESTNYTTEEKQELVRMFVAVTSPRTKGTM